MVIRSREPERLASFYVDTLGFEAHVAPVGIELRAGTSRMVLSVTSADALPYPPSVPGWSPLFQHCALRVPDMDDAYARLCRDLRWRPISQEGPEQLPARSGGVRAFKFRDPEGHPLELLDLGGGADAEETPVTLDHSALSVVDLDRSIAFYDGLGLIVRSRSLNTGIEQARLDDVSDARVDVVALGVPGNEPHIELLCYRDVGRAQVTDAGIDDIASTRLVFETNDGEVLRSRMPSSVARKATQLLLRDPDGHLVELVLAAAFR